MHMEELPDDVQAKLKTYREEVEAAYRSEFEVVDSKIAGARTVSRDQLAELAGLAVSTLGEVMREGEKDSDRISAAKYVLDKVLGKDTVLDPDDPAQRLLEKLTQDS